MRRVYFFILLVLIIGKKIESTACGEATTEACDPVVLRCCDANFRADLNIPSTVCNGASTYYNPSCYRSQIVQAYRDGKAEGVLMVCKAFASYRTCLGISGLSCYSVDYFVQHSFDPNQAKTYVQMIRELTFACGGGLELSQKLPSTKVSSP
uniref:Kazal-like domain-containing protein n=1 Tax=Rhabditophanes sp. KR3021 TaxID=114890 RepID=A0AC35U763_9BILA